MKKHRKNLTDSIGAFAFDEHAVRQFVTQRANPADSTSMENSTRASELPHLDRSAKSDSRTSRVGLIPITVRLRPDVADGLKRASLEGQLAEEPNCTQQKIVTAALEQWFRTHATRKTRR